MPPWEFLSDLCESSAISAVKPFFAAKAASRFLMGIARNFVQVFEARRRTPIGQQASEFSTAPMLPSVTNDLY
jgi:hypothetical protein